MLFWVVYIYIYFFLFFLIFICFWISVEKQYVPPPLQSATVFWDVSTNWPGSSHRVTARFSKKNLYNLPRCFAKITDFKKCKKKFIKYPPKWALCTRTWLALYRPLSKGGDLCTTYNKNIVLYSILTAFCNFVGCLPNALTCCSCGKFGIDIMTGSFIQVHFLNFNIVLNFWDGALLILRMLWTMNNTAMTWFWLIAKHWLVCWKMGGCNMLPPKLIMLPCETLLDWTIIWPCMMRQNSCHWIEQDFLLSILAHLLLH